MTKLEKYTWSHFRTDLIIGTPVFGFVGLLIWAVVAGK